MSNLNDTYVHVVLLILQNNFSPFLGLTTLDISPMIRYVLLVVVIGLKFISNAVTGQLHPSLPAEYQPLPPLRQRALIQDQWIAARISKIPLLLQRYDVQAWLVSLPVFSLFTGSQSSVFVSFVNVNTPKIQFGGRSKMLRTSTLIDELYSSSTIINPLWQASRIHSSGSITPEMYGLSYCLLSIGLTPLASC